MQSTLLQYCLPATALALAAGLGACSSGSDLDGGGGPSPPADPPPSIPSECSQIVEGSWFVDIRSLTGGPLLDQLEMTQNGCLVFGEQDGWRLSGALHSEDTWVVEITRDGEVVGNFDAQFKKELESPLFRLESELSGSVDGEPILEVSGHVNPAALSITAFDPAQGLVDGGAEVEVQGGGYFSFGLEFIFDGRPAELLQRIDDSTALVRTPAGDMPEAVDVTVLAADEEEGEPTVSFTLDAAFTYCSFVVATGTWDLIFDGAVTTGELTISTTEEPGDCIATLTLAGDTMVMSGPVDVNGVWNVEYEVSGGLMGTGLFPFAPEDPSRAFTGTITLEAGGTIDVSGTIPEPEEE